MWLRHDHGDAKSGGQDAAGRGDAPKEFAFHNDEAIVSWRIMTQAVIDKESGQIKQAAEPGDHENQVECFEPEYCHDGIRPAGMVWALLY